MPTHQHHQAEDTTPARVFVSGQSNALGRAEDGPDWSAINKSVRVWNNANPLRGIGSSFVSAEEARAGGPFQHTDPNHLINNFGVWFCDRFAREFDRPVDMTIVARGASWIHFWDPAEQTYPMLQDCINVWAATAQPPAHIFLWHQGEGHADIATSYDDYSTAFLSLVDNLKNGGVIDDNTLIILGGLAEEKDGRQRFNHEVLKTLADNHDRIAYAPSHGLKTYDRTHFNGDSLHTFGSERYFEALIELRRQQRVSW